MIDLVFSQLISLFSSWSQILIVSLVVMLLTAYFLIHENQSTWYPDENTYVDPNNKNEREAFPSLYSSPSLFISLIVPSYNEEQRLPQMMEDTLSYLKDYEKKRKGKGDQKFTWEIIIVDDGSKDKTAEIALNYVRREGADKIRLLKLHRNRGKGGAVKRGTLCARGKYLLFLDADGAAQIDGLERLEDSMLKIEKNGLGISIGSRAHLQDDVVARRSFFRNILMWGFHLAVSILGVRGIKDTQCGFKLFSRNAAQLLFPNLHIERWAFDFELLYLAQRMKIPMIEIPINWVEIPGSKLSPVQASFQMARDLLRVRLAYLFGFWTTSTYGPN